MNRLIVAVDRKLGLAKHGFMPWNIPEDEQFFTDKTKSEGGITLTGHGTFKTFKGPLVDRQNYILTRQDIKIEGVSIVHELEQFLDDFKDQVVWVVGGAKVFEQVMALGRADELYITHIDADFGCDQFFPAYEDRFELQEKSERREQNGFFYTYARYTKKAT